MVGLPAPFSGAALSSGAPATWSEPFNYTPGSSLLGNGPWFDMINGPITVVANSSVSAATNATSSIFALNPAGTIDWSKAWTLTASVVTLLPPTGLKFRLFGGGVTPGTDTWTALFDVINGRLQYLSPTGASAGTATLSSGGAATWVVSYNGNGTISLTSSTGGTLTAGGSVAGTGGSAFGFQIDQAAVAKISLASLSFSGTAL